MNYFLAIDIGASSGRHIIGWKEGDDIKTDEVYRFANGATKKHGYLCWDIDALKNNVIAGVKKAFEKYPAICSISVDTWGCDYVLMNGEKPILPCYCYRDGRTESIIDSVHKLMPQEKLYSKTGIQFQPFNTIYQLSCDLLSGRLGDGIDFLMIPEYISFCLTGRKKHELTNATTTGLLNAYSKTYDEQIISALKLPKEMFGKIYIPGEVVGELSYDIQKQVGGNAPVVLCASHDTASAVEGLSMTDNSPYISSGTWSLLGIKLKRPLTDAVSMSGNWTNEGGIGYIRYQKNIMGMWVVNRLKDELMPQENFSHIVELAKKSDFAEVVDVDDKIFLAPESMVNAFDYMLKEKPKNEIDYFRCAFNSLAKSYAKALKELKENTNIDFDKLYIVGGGAKNDLLNDLTEKACGVKVVALPIEATSIGNLKVQMENYKKH